jgi:hypothetical protein
MVAFSEPSAPAPIEPRVFRITVERRVGAIDVPDTQIRTIIDACAHAVPDGNWLEYALQSYQLCATIVSEMKRTHILYTWLNGVSLLVVSTPDIYTTRADDIEREIEHELSTIRTTNTITWAPTDE